jgi:hypothetical protein
MNIKTVIKIYFLMTEHLKMKIKRQSNDSFILHMREFLIYFSSHRDMLMSIVNNRLYSNIFSILQSNNLYYVA